MEGKNEEVEDEDVDVEVDFMPGDVLGKAIAFVNQVEVNTYYK